MLGAHGELAAGVERRLRSAVSEQELLERSMEAFVDGVAGAKRGTGGVDRR